MRELQTSEIKALKKLNNQRAFDVINETEIERANIGDIFTGYGVLANGAVLTGKIKNGEWDWYANFRELKRNGDISKYSFDYLSFRRGKLGDTHRERYDLKWAELLTKQEG